MDAVRRHPDYVGGTIFVRGGDTRTITDDEADSLRRILEDRLAETGNAIIADDGLTCE
jgi:hypothetical protein